MRPRIEPFVADDEPLSEDAGLAAEAARRGFADEARLWVPLDADLAEDRAPELERLDVVREADGEEAAVAPLGLLRLLADPLDFALEEERFDAARVDPEEDRDRLLEPLVVAMAINLFRLFA